jgi:hypothetical protein
LIGFASCSYCRPKRATPHVQTAAECERRKRLVYKRWACPESAWSTCNRRAVKCYPSSDCCTRLSLSLSGSRCCMSMPHHRRRFRPKREPAAVLNLPLMVPGIAFPSSRLGTWARVSTSRFHLVQGRSPSGRHSIFDTDKCGGTVMRKFGALSFFSLVHIYNLLYPGAHSNDGPRAL